MADCCCSSQPATVGATDSRITGAHRLDHLLARAGINRSGHRVPPGLYAIGAACAESPVFVTANYTLSFDALRCSLAGIDGYILILDTRGVNVWCAAGKGTFGTEELVERITEVRLAEIVSHRRLILPQLGAPGISAQEVKQRSGFRVAYGPVRARDLPAYLHTGEATPEMRRVTFGMWDRLILVPVEIRHLIVPILIAAGVLLLLGGWLAALAAVVAMLAGAVLFPALMPWIPTRDFSSKGFLLGGLVALPFAAAALGSPSTGPIWLRAGFALGAVLAVPAITAFLSLNFTGSTTFASKSGVEREIMRYAPAMAWLFGGGIVISGALRLIHFLGVA